MTVTASDADSPGSALTAAASGLPAGMSLTLGSTSGEDTRPGVRTWTVSGATTSAPGSYPVAIAVTDDTGFARTTSFTVVVSTEDAEATYTGDMLAFTSGSSGSATVQLRTTVRDSSVLPGSTDSAPGDVRNATVTFKEGSTTICTAAVGLVSGATTIGSANCAATLALGSHAITVEVGGYYTGDTSALVEAAKADGSFVTGGGFLAPTRSAGVYPADTGSKTYFAFAVKNGKNLSGHVEVLLQSGDRFYEIHSTTLESLGLTSGTTAKADLRSKTNLIDVTNPLHPTTIGRGWTLQLTATDRGEPGRNDSLALTLWNGNTLVFSSDWTGAQTQELKLGGGNLVIH